VARAAGRGPVRRPAPDLEPVGLPPDPALSDVGGVPQHPRSRRPRGGRDRRLHRRRGGAGAVVVDRRRPGPRPAGRRDVAGQSGRGRRPRRARRAPRRRGVGQRRARAGPGAVADRRPDRELARVGRGRARPGLGGVPAARPDRRRRGRVRPRSWGRPRAAGRRADRARRPGDRGRLRPLPVRDLPAPARDRRSPDRRRPPVPDRPRPPGDRDVGRRRPGQRRGVAVAAGRTGRRRLVGARPPPRRRRLRRRVRAGGRPRLGRGGRGAAGRDPGRSREPQVAGGRAVHRPDGGGGAGHVPGLAHADPAAAGAGADLGADRRRGRRLDRGRGRPARDRRAGRRLQPHERRAARVAADPGGSDRGPDPRAARQRAVPRAAGQLDRSARGGHRSRLPHRQGQRRRRAHAR
jgi:hypothetical protein